MNKSSIFFLLSFIIIINHTFAQKNEIAIGFTVLTVSNKNIIEAANPFKFISINYNRILNRHLGITLNIMPDLINGNRTSMTVRSMLDSNSLYHICERDGNLHFLNLQLYLIYKIKHISIMPMLGFTVVRTNDYYLTELVLAPPPPLGEGDIIWLDGYWKKKLYFGLPIGMAIGYPIYKNKVTINGTASYTKFIKDFPSTFSFGLSVGYRF
ncbi:MAG: hypothetical protein IPK62_09370 [Bacteroidetes bacterium]|nr:hypothetical protein [Bacteroidota bacterium]MBK8145182.1 hypothetical protein [Bacteroidota bacterium]